MSIDANAVVDRIYEAALVPELWPEVLGEVCSTFDSFAGTVLVVSPEAGMRGVASRNADEALQKFLATPELPMQSPRTLAALAAPASRFIRVCDLLSPSELEADPMEHAMRQAGLGAQVYTMVPMPSGDTAILAFTRLIGDADHPVSVVDRLNGMRPHMARAASLAARLGVEQARAMTAALQTMGVPAAALTAGGRVLDVNGAFERVGALRAGAFGQLAIDCTPAQALFDQAMRSAGTSMVGDVCSIAVPACEDHAPLVLHLVPIRGAAHDFFARAAWLLVVSVFGEGAGVPSLPLLHGLFDFTPKEAALAASLASGHPLRDAAMLNGIQYSTARTHLEHIFQKTGVKQQTQLVLLLQGARAMGPHT